MRTFLLSVCLFLLLSPYAWTETRALTQIPHFLWGPLLESELKESTALADYSDAYFQNQFPLIPITQSGFGKNQFIGVKIPRQFLDETQSTSSPNSPTRISDFPRTRKAREAFDLLQSYRDENGQGLNVIFHNGDVYGFDPKYDVQYTKNDCIFFCPSFGGGKTIYLGDNFTLGFSLNLSFQGVEVGQQSGLNLSASLQKSISELSAAMNGESSETVLQKILNISAQSNQIFISQLEQRQIFQSGKGEAALITPRKSFVAERPKLPNLNPPSLQHLSPELQKALGDLNRTLDEEIDWQQKVRASVGSTMIINNKKMNQFMQMLCDRVALAYQIPEQLWPRCHVAAEVIPNAWAYPGGDLFFSVGLIGLLNSVDGLMYTVGHEMGHVVGKHTTQMRPGFNALDGLGSILGFAMNAFQIVTIKELFSSTHVLSRIGKAFFRGEALGRTAQLTMMASTAAVMMYSRDNERQADRFGQETSFAAGASSQGLIDGQRDMKNFINQIGPPKNFLSKILASHPPSQERIENMMARERSVVQNLGAYNAENALPEALVSQFEGYHNWAAKHLESYIAKKKAKAGGARTLEELFVNAYATRGSQCLFHLFDLEHSH